MNKKYKHIRERNGHYDLHKLQITGKPRNKSTRYIAHTHNNKYAIYKKIPGTNKGSTYFGTFNTLKEAIQYRDYLEENNWDKKLIKFTFKKSSRNTRYITAVKHARKNGSVMTKYRIFHAGIYYGTFNTLKEAIFERDLLESVDWDYDALMELPVECWSEDSI